MRAEDRLLRCKTWSEEATWSKISTEIVHIINDMHIGNITTLVVEKGLSYPYIEKIIYGIWWLSEGEGKENIILFSIFCLPTVTWDTEYKEWGRFRGKMLSIDLDVFGVSYLLDIQVRWVGS